MTEEEQERLPDKPDHICTTYGARVYHRASTTDAPHEELFPCKECVAEGYKRYQPRDVQVHVDLAQGRDFTSYEGMIR